MVMKEIRIGKNPFVLISKTSCVISYSVFQFHLFSWVIAWKKAATLLLRFFRRLPVRSPPGKGKETAATQARNSVTILQWGHVTNNFLTFVYSHKFQTWEEHVLTSESTNF